MNPSPALPMEAARPVEAHPTQHELWQRYHQSADVTVENDLVERYLPLVKTVVGRLAMTLPSHVDLDDLNSAGLIGLLQAIRNYNPQCNTSFETYARLRIRGAVLDELRRMDWVPRSVHEKARKVQNTMFELEQNLGRAPTEDQMAKALELTLPQYQRLLEEIRPATFVCLDAALFPGTGDSSTVYESISDHTQEDPTERTSRRELSRLIANRLEQLPDMQRKVLALYYYEDLRLREIAEVFGLTESRICQIHSQAILALKASIERYESSADYRRHQPQP